MGRRPIGKQAMTGAERWHRWRKKQPQPRLLSRGELYLAIRDFKDWFADLTETIDTAAAAKTKPTWTHAEVVDLLVTIEDRLPTTIIEDEEDDEWDDE